MLDVDEVTEHDSSTPRHARIEKATVIKATQPQLITVCSQFQIQHVTHSDGNAYNHDLDNNCHPPQLGLLENDPRAAEAR